MTIDEKTQEEQRLTHTTRIEAGTQNARDAAALAREAVAIEARLGARRTRFLTDLVGEYYTLVLESV
jgi:hypothetical protein